jgi:hypothetical protein
MTTLRLDQRSNGIRLDSAWVRYYADVRASTALFWVDPSTGCKRGDARRGAAWDGEKRETTDGCKGRAEVPCFLGKPLKSLAGATGLEPATFGMTGHRSRNFANKFKSSLNKCVARTGDTPSFCPNRITAKTSLEVRCRPLRSRERAFW